MQNKHRYHLPIDDDKIIWAPKLTNPPTHTPSTARQKNLLADLTDRVARTNIIIIITTTTIIIITIY